MRSLAFLAVLCAAAPASAQFMTMDRTDDKTFLDGEISFIKLDEIDIDDALGVRLEFSGEWKHPTQPFGIYGHLPVGMVFGELDGWRLSNIEANGLYVLPQPQGEFIFRGGVSLDIGSSDDFEDVFAGILTGIARLTDLAGSAPETSWLRGSASYRHRAGTLLLRFDFGIDYPFDDTFTDDPLFRGNAAIGIPAGTLLLSGELVNVANLTGDGDFSDRIIHSLAFAIRSGGPLQFYGGPVFFLDDIDEVFVITFGVQNYL